MTKKLTKGAVADYVKHQLKTDDKWAKAALLKIYEFQTEDEKRIGDTREYNNVGFSGAHAEIMSSFAVQLLGKGWLSPKQMIIVHKIICKYSRQIIQISDEDKLHEMVTKSIS